MLYRIFWPDQTPRATKKRRVQFLMNAPAFNRANTVLPWDKSIRVKKDVVDCLSSLKRRTVIKNPGKKFAMVLFENRLMWKEVYLDFWIILSKTQLLSINPKEATTKMM